eukprot:scaffold107834_cov21-Tisochrysis_lutea.AAC.1
MLSHPFSNAQASSQSSPQSPSQACSGILLVMLTHAQGLPTIDACSVMLRLFQAEALNRAKTCSVVLSVLLRHSLRHPLRHAQAVLQASS